MHTMIFMYCMGMNPDPKTWTAKVAIHLQTCLPAFVGPGTAAALEIQT